MIELKEQMIFLLFIVLLMLDFWAGIRKAKNL